eukprot:jgi/Tetstr1/454506/TSEL_041405.t1
MLMRPAFAWHAQSLGERLGWRVYQAEVLDRPLIAARMRAVLRARTGGRWMEQLMDSFSAGRCADVEGGSARVCGRAASGVAPGAGGERLCGRPRCRELHPR